MRGVAPRWRRRSEVRTGQQRRTLADRRLPGHVVAPDQAGCADPEHVDPGRVRQSIGADLAQQVTRAGAARLERVGAGRGAQGCHPGPDPVGRGRGLAYLFALIVRLIHACFFTTCLPRPIAHTIGCRQSVVTLGFAL